MLPDSVNKNDFYYRVFAIGRGGFKRIASINAQM